jgi:hypothetical protein
MVHASLLSALVISVSAMAPSPDPRLQARLTGATRDAVIAIVDSAERDGLKAEPLVQLALEATSKGAVGERIIVAVRRHADLMRRARAALGPGSTPEDVAAGALALKHGMDVGQLERLRQSRSGRRFAAALNSLVFIVGKGVPADTAGNLIVGLVLASATDEQIAAMQAQIERDISGGTSAVLAATARAYGLTREIEASARNDGGAPGSSLPSARGSMRADPSASGPVAPNAAGSAGTIPGDGSRPPAGPRGKPPKRP